jgi:hypothetical protein
MAWLAALIVIIALGALAFKLERTDEGWREQCEGLRKRWEGRDAPR